MIPRRRFHFLHLELLLILCVSASLAWLVFRARTPKENSPCPGILRKTPPAEGLPFSVFLFSGDAAANPSAPLSPALFAFGVSDDPLKTELCIPENAFIPEAILALHEPLPVPAPPFSPRRHAALSFPTGEIATRLRPAPPLFSGAKAPSLRMDALASPEPSRTPVETLLAQLDAALAGTPPPAPLSCGNEITLFYPPKAISPILVINAPSLSPAERQSLEKAFLTHHVTAAPEARTVRLSL